MLFIIGFYVCPEVAVSTLQGDGTTVKIFFLSFIYKKVPVCTPTSRGNVEMRVKEGAVGRIV